MKEDAQSITDGTQSKLIGLEKEQLEWRRDLYEVQVLGITSMIDQTAFPTK